MRSSIVQALFQLLVQIRNASLLQEIQVLVVEEGLLLRLEHLLADLKQLRPI